MCRKAIAGLLALGILGSAASGAIVSSTTHGDASFNDLAKPIAVGDLLSGKTPAVDPGDLGWHPANTDPQDQLSAFTDDHGPNGRGLYGLLNDFPGEGTPTKLVTYDLGGPHSIAEIRIFTGNIGGQDGRIFSTTRVFTSTDGVNFTPLGPNSGYYQSDPSGTLNNAASSPRYATTLVDISDDQNGLIATGVTHIRFHFYAVDNTGGQMRDPFEGPPNGTHAVNPFTGADDGLGFAFESPLVYEIDVLAGEICDNGIDDNGDGKIDCADPQCGSFAACQCGHPFADVDHDNDVDQEDFAVFQTCYTGPTGSSVDYPCKCLDRDNNGAIDQNDFAQFELCMSGPAVPWSPAVAPACIP